MRFSVLSFLLLLLIGGLAFAEEQPTLKLVKTISLCGIPIDVR